jgi:hypothetical protein
MVALVTTSNAHSSLYPKPYLRQNGTKFCLDALPLELQIRVWENSLPPQRTARVRHTFEERMKFRNGRRLWIRKLIASANVPDALKVNRFSRRLYQEHYKKSFERQLHHKPIYFDYRVDKLRFDHIVHMSHATRNCTTAAFNIDVLVPVRHLEVRNFIADLQLQYIATKFKNLETLTLQDFPNQNAGVLKILQNCWDDIGMSESKRPSVTFSA